MGYGNRPCNCELRRMVNGLTWCIMDWLGGRESYGPAAEVLTYLGPNDARYGVLLLATIKAVYMAIPLTGRQVLGAIKSPVPSVEEHFVRQYEPFVLHNPSTTCVTPPLWHTPRTAGLPKSITWTHETCAQDLASKSRETINGVGTAERYLKKWQASNSNVAGALFAQLRCGAIPYGNIVIAPIAAAIPSPRVVVDALKKAKANVATPVSSIAAELAQGIVSGAMSNFAHASAEVTDGVYKLSIRRDRVFAGAQPGFTVSGIDQLEEYRTKDLWCYRARNITSSNPELSGVLVAGAQRLQAALLIEPNSKTPLTTSE
ncbi:hypothetical protein O1611_g1390 [Lasiodiplodia mahajangana]|uniref:Uncharacterized protein n=1 Tax=Lasiodiplodia mahajangana TaxID=1108764 RepID=A0ACC2JXQ0_9PEZI|nr:hypothetical protein O1611_g1390 [Lasiodiplodia mahajangana]